jgi:hypothetical protein
VAVGDIVNVTVGETVFGGDIVGVSVCRGIEVDVGRELEVAGRGERGTVVTVCPTGVDTIVGVTVSNAEDEKASVLF